ncbi:MAG: 4-(cytidine 5'-diphospho)-2-C-methyl-D-erythritol kinase [Verrucomicrobia bacterium]|nr:4-(cytidine 5'-diphospho)-2-C-methyl-D-erythritol kinase [Verrucomicrobiota bacterium]
MPSLVFAAPAKVNLLLAITGRRPDGFHDLVSVVATLDLADTLEAEPAAEFSLVCDDPELTSGPDNLVLRAAAAFRRETGWASGVAFRLRKRIPAGAGLGGGSSDAVAALRALNQLAPPDRRLHLPGLTRLAAELGSDCPLFLAEGPVVLRGRGERVEPLLPAEVARLRGRRLLVCKPAFGIPTPSAYARLAKGAPGSYWPAAEAEAWLARWRADPAAPAEALLRNTMEAPAFAKFPALPELLIRLKAAAEVEGRMSGSGSACFALLPEGMPVAPLLDLVRTGWGPSAFATEARIA